jgi:hypothetical protein
MCLFGGHHETLNVTRQCHSMKSGVWPPIKKKMCAKTRKQWTELIKMGF